MADLALELDQFEDIVAQIVKQRRPWRPVLLGLTLCIGLFAPWGAFRGAPSGEQTAFQSQAEPLAGIEAPTAPAPVREAAVPTITKAAIEQKLAAALLLPDLAHRVPASVPSVAGLVPPLRVSTKPPTTLTLGQSAVPAVAASGPASPVLSPAKASVASADQTVPLPNNALDAPLPAPAVAPAFAASGSGEAVAMAEAQADSGVKGQDRGLLLVARHGDTLTRLYRNVYYGMTPPPFADIAAANPGLIQPGRYLVFPKPPGGWRFLDGG